MILEQNAIDAKEILKGIFGTDKALGNPTRV
jgi:hypothetical protein